MKTNPFLTSTTVTAGANTTANSTDLANPFGGKYPILIEELKFWTPLGVTYIPQIKLAIGGHPITHGFVPIWLLSNVNTTGSTGVGLIWRLKKPLYIPAGRDLTAQVYHPSSSIVYTITYVGKSLEGGFAPQASAVPWISAFVPPTIATGAANSVVASKASQLVNATKKPLQVTHLAGRVGRSTGAEEAYFNQFLVRLVDSESNVVIRSNTPLQDVFALPTRTWPMNTVVKPGGYFRATIEQKLAAYNAGVTLSPQIAMCGYRMENL